MPMHQPTSRQTHMNTINMSFNVKMIINDNTINLSFKGEKTINDS